MPHFKPAFGIKNSHLQTLFSTFFRRPTIEHFDIEEFALDDGDFLDCYWLKKPAKENVNQSPTPPIVIIFHGLTGSFQSPYIQGIMQHLTKQGYACVLMHFRGCSGRINRTARAYHSGDTHDAKAWVSHVKKHYPNSALFAIGYSLGANMLLKMLAEYAQKSPFSATTAISAPLQLETSAATLQTGFARVYQYYLLRLLKKSLLLKYPQYDYPTLINLDFKQVQQIATIEEFDELYTSRIHGFTDAAHYYRVSSAKQYLTEIKTKTLIINAEDDPFMQASMLPTADQVSSDVTLQYPRKGGHLGFISGSVFKPVYWLESRISDFFSHSKDIH